ncbi:MAG: ABC transporter permease [Bacteroidetes bacterium]|nr:ABC transporter permease [Bacteroidota bacterium]MCL5025904.1 ABC transporter permease [Chloroflexota bacterium]
MLQRIWAMVYKEFIQIRRDRRTLAMVLALPVIQLLIFGYAINTQVQHIRMVVNDQSKDADSRAFVDAFVNTTYFDLVEYLDSDRAVRESVDSGNAKVGLLIPPDFSANLRGGRQAQAQVLIDGSDPNTAQTALFVSSSIAQVRAADQVAAILSRITGQSGVQAAIDLRPVVLYNPNMESVDFMVPGLIGLILQFQGTILTAFSIVRERERGTLEQLIVTPIRAWELMLGKLLPYTLIAMSVVPIIVGVGVFWFKVEMAGSFWLLLALAFVFLLGTLGLGMLVSTVSRTQVQAMQGAQFILLPSFLLAGFFYPVESMPAFLQPLSYFIPLTYFLRIIRGIVLKGIGLEFLWPQVIPLMLYSLALFWISARRFQKRLE